MDILVNNAGIMAYGLFHEIPIERMDRLMHLALPYMIKRGEGRILNALYQPFSPRPIMRFTAHPSPLSRTSAKRSARI